VPDPTDGRRFSLKILDFGLAKVKGEEPLTTTRTGCVIGTALYMAPERWHASQPVDHRSDIYALGCLFFELLCGRPPFCESSDADIMRAHLVEAPPELADLAPDLPPAFQLLLARMLAKSPEARHGSVDEVLAELEPILGRDRSSWRRHLRMPRASGLPLTALDDDTQPDARLGIGRGAALVAWLRGRLSVPTWLRDPAGALTSLRRPRLSRWVRNRRALLNRLRERIRLPAPLRVRFGRWFDDVSFRMAIGGSIVILGAALLLTGRPSTSSRDGAGPGSPPAAAPPLPPADRGASNPLAAPAQAPATGVAPTTAEAPGVPPTPLVPAPGRRVNSYSVLVTSDPPGAQAWLPGERTARGRTPLDIELVSRRPRRLRLVAPGFRTATLIISGARAGARAHARLTPAEGPRRPAAGRRQSRPTPDPFPTYRPAGD
jgi:hypothetical protein